MAKPRFCFVPRGLLSTVLEVEEPDGPLGRIGRLHEQRVEGLLELSSDVVAEGVSSNASLPLYVIDNIFYRE